jgi:DnaJ-class molecular chaperone
MRTYSKKWMDCEACEGKGWRISSGPMQIQGIRYKCLLCDGSGKVPVFIEDQSVQSEPSKYLEHYQKAINEIDDLMEYRYKIMSPEDIKNSISAILYALSNSMGAIKKEG